MSRKKIHNKKASNFPLLVTLLIIFIFLSIVGILRFINTVPNSLKIASDGSKNTLQLGAFFPSPKAKPTPLPTRTTLLNPTPTAIPPECPHDRGNKMVECKCSTGYAVECKAKQCVSVRGFGIREEGCVILDLASFTCDYPNAVDGDGWYCIAKPVIYLYPEKDTLVNVRVVTEGKVVISDPQIETENGPALSSSNGWTDVLAHPNGQLEYQGKEYRELFYESESTTLNAPTKGIIIKTSELQPKLKEYIALLGLTRLDEQDEFLEWWVPRLESLNKPYIFFSILDKSEKQRLDQVFITPKPDVFIEFIAYFRPMDKIEPIEQLELTPAPKRHGFTAIEWGGVVDP